MPTSSITTSGSLKQHGSSTAAAQQHHSNCNSKAATDASPLPPSHHNLSVISSCFHPEEPSKCARYYADDLKALDVTLSESELDALDRVTEGKRTCTDCYTDECQECARALHSLGCPLGVNGWGTTWWHVGDNLTEHPAWGRSNINGTRCMECAYLPQNRAEVERGCGWSERGETVETMVPKACGF